MRQSFRQNCNMIQTKVLFVQFTQNKTDESMNKASYLRKTKKDSKACLLLIEY